VLVLGEAEMEKSGPSAITIEIADEALGRFESSPGKVATIEYVPGVVGL
jgi:hypothetical protein